MCGIAGILGPSFKKPFPLRALTHRGPDAEGAWKDERAHLWLGHRRLSILDLSEAGAQPMSFLNGRYQIVFNGEIYNFLELQDELKTKGYDFRSHSDTEIIPAAFDCWGIECLHRFNGMWAFALWDGLKKELWLARDRFGKKPLYYHQDTEDFVFCSEVKAIHQWLNKDAELDSDVIRSICAGKFEWHGTDRTYLREVKSLPAGHWLLKSANPTKVDRWYQLSPSNIQIPKKLDDQAAKLRELIVDACRIRLRSDVPIATCLSGGVDSSSVTAIIHRGMTIADERTAKDFHRVFCAAFPGTMLDETHEAKSLARVLGADLTVCEIMPPNADRLMEAISSCDGPMHALAYYPIWELYARIAKAGVKVTMDGQGPDEMLGGYIETVQSGLLAALLQGNLRWFWDLLRIYGEHGESRFRSSKSFVRGELVALMKLPLSRVKQSVLRQKSSEPIFSFAQPTPRGLDPFGRELYHQFCQAQLPTILQQFDRCSMAHGVECRMPFMDYRIVEFVFSLPNESRVGEGFTKRVLRKAVDGLVPDANRLNKVKIGFNAPIVEWFTGSLRELMLDTMRSIEFRQTQYFDGIALRTQFEQWLKNPKWDGAWGFWPPVHYVLWKQQMYSARHLFSSRALSA